MTIVSGSNERQAIKQAYWLMFGLLLLRIVFAAYPPLGVDEAYAIAAARGYSLSFFDHPPVGFVSPLLSAALLGVETPFVFRIPTIVFGTGTAWMLWKIGDLLGGPRAALWSLGLYAASPAFALSGSYIVPDAPLGLGTTICVYWLIRLQHAGGSAPFRWWIWVGLSLAFALASKYQAALIPVMVLFFALATPGYRFWLFRPGAYVASAIGLAGLLPMLVWNMQNDWASFTFHSGRTGDGLNLDNFAFMLVGQALYLLPPVAVLACVGLWKGLTRWQGRNDVFLVALIALGPVVAFNAIYLFSERSYPHWTMPGWIFALALSAVVVASWDDGARKRARRWVVILGAIFMTLLGLALVHTRTGLLTRFTHDAPPPWDRTIDAFDYSSLGPALDGRGILGDVDLIATRGWIEAGFMSTALKGAYPVKVLRGNKHHFQFLPGQTMGGAALLLHPALLSDLQEQSDRTLRIAQAEDVEAVLLEPVIMQRGGADYAAVIVVRLRLPPG